MTTKQDIEEVFYGWNIAFDKWRNEHPNWDKRSPIDEMVREMWVVIGCLKDYLLCQSNLRKDLKAMLEAEARREQKEAGK